MGFSRYELRSRLATEAPNAIGSASLRSGLRPAPEVNRWPAFSCSVEVNHPRDIQSQRSILYLLKRSFRSRWRLRTEGVTNVSSSIGEAFQGDQALQLPGLHCICLRSDERCGCRLS